MNEQENLRTNVTSYSANCTNTVVAVQQSGEANVENICVCRA